MARRWTKQDRDALRRTVSENPHNLTLAFTKYASRHNRSLNAVRGEYYKNPYYRQGITFLTIGRSNVTINGKNKNQPSGRHSLWRTIKSFFLR